MRALVKIDMVKKQKTLLIIGYVWPEPRSSAAGSRMLQLIHIFKAEGYAITFASSCAKTDNAYPLETLGVSQETIVLNDSSFDTFIKTLQPNIVMFDRFMMEEQYGWRVAAHCPEALRVLDTEDLHFLRKARQQAFKANAPVATYLKGDMAKREIASIYRSDISLIISTYEMHLLKTQFSIPPSLLHYLPFLIDESHLTTQTLPTFEARQHFIFIGNFMHAPNYDAVMYLKQTLLPRIRQELPKAELHIYGAYTPQKVKQLHNTKAGFLVKGFAENVHTVMQQARVCLVPVRFGAGLKGKLVDAMLNGTPVVTTAVGAEGLVQPVTTSGTIAETPEAFVDAAVALYANASHWDVKHQKMPESITTYLSVNQHVPIFNNLIRETLSHLQEKRDANFTGAMLMHHTLQSTKYLSKWIEAKNKVD